MNAEDLEVMLSKKVRGVSYEEVNGQGYLVIVTTGGGNFYFTSEAPIELNLEREQ
jgi:hypothetical protein